MKQLYLESDVLSRMEVYRILSHCPNLEYLEMQVSDCVTSVPFNGMKKCAVQANIAWDKIL